MKFRVVIALFTTAAFLSLAACSKTPDMNPGEGD
jgi:hypothetical protein